MLGVIYVIFQPGAAPPGHFAPAAAVDRAMEKGLSGPVLNDYDFGGYLTFRGIPTFIDGRTLLFGKEFALKYFNAGAPDGAAS